VPVAINVTEVVVINYDLEFAEFSSITGGGFQP